MEGSEERILTLLTAPLRCEIHRREVSSMLQQSKRPYDAQRAEALPKRIRGSVAKWGRVQEPQQTQQSQQPSSSTRNAETSAQQTVEKVVDVLFTADAGESAQRTAEQVVDGACHSSRWNEWSTTC